MGCGAIRSEPEFSPLYIPPARRRLSVGSIEADFEDEGITVKAPEEEEDRSLIRLLNDQQLLDLAGEVVGTGRKYSIGSETDQEMHRKGSNSQKDVKIHGDPFQPQNEGLGYACKKGLKPEAPNQDSFLILKVEGHFSVYGVFDGHGRKGHDVSNFVKDQLPKILVAQVDIESDTPNALRSTFKMVQHLIEQATDMKKLDAERSGTTATVVVHHHQKHILFVAHVGDSRSVLGKKSLCDGGEAVWRSLDLTVDHKPEDPKELEIIRKGGGEVRFDGHFNHRVYAKGKRYPGLNMSRSMGDLKGYYDAGISPVPDVARRRVPAPSASKVPPEPEPPDVVERRDSVDGDGMPPLKDQFLLVCSDGVWGVVSSDEAVQLVSAFDVADAMQAADALAQMAWDRWIETMGGSVVDDITVLLVHLVHGSSLISGSLMGNGREGSANDGIAFIE